MLPLSFTTETGTRQRGPDPAGQRHLDDHRDAVGSSPDRRVGEHDSGDRVGHAAARAARRHRRRQLCRACRIAGSAGQRCFNVPGPAIRAALVLNNWTSWWANLAGGCHWRSHGRRDRRCPAGQGRRPERGHRPRWARRAPAGAPGASATPSPSPQLRRVHRTDLPVPRRHPQLGDRTSLRVPGDRPERRAPRNNVRRHSRSLPDALPRLVAPRQVPPVASVQPDHPELREPGPNHPTGWFPG